MPNHQVTYELTAPCETEALAAQAMEDVLERYPSTMTLYFGSVAQTPGGFIAWAIYDGQFSRLIQDAYHIHETENLKLVEV